MDNLKNYSETACYVKAGLTGISGAATTHSTGATTIQFAIAGKAYSKTQISGGATPTTEGKTGAAITLTANNGRCLVWAFDVSGNVKVFAGDIVAMDAGGNFLKAPPFPTDMDLDTYCPFAYVLMKGASTVSGTFTVGSSNWNSAGMSYTVVDVSTLPGRPQTT